MAIFSDVPIRFATLDDFPGAPEVVENGRQGYLIPPGDVSGLAEVLFKLSMSPAERKTLGHNALERAQAFDLAGVVSEYLRLFERITTR